MFDFEISSVWPWPWNFRGRNYFCYSKAYTWLYSFVTSIDTFSLSLTVIEIFDFKVFRAWPFYNHHENYLSNISTYYFCENSASQNENIIKIGAHFICPYWCNFLLFFTRMPAPHAICSIPAPNSLFLCESFPFNCSPYFLYLVVPERVSNYNIVKQRPSK